MILGGVDAIMTFRESFEERGRNREIAEYYNMYPIRWIR